MPNKLLQSAIHKALSWPLLFDLQQKVFNNYKAVRKQFVTYMDAPGLAVLDVGCSTGASAAALVDLQKHEYTGIELMPEYAAIAQRRGLRGRFLAMDATQMSFADASFDRVLFTGVLHHMEDGIAKASLAESFRVLKPGGWLLAAEPMFTPGERLTNFLLAHDRGSHIRTAEEYKALFGGRPIAQEGAFRFSFHRFISLALRKEA
jgi:ubiquinone/menaquinone biosynthesis C-methylase UbiE